jgi:hypothetical protein
LRRLIRSPRYFWKAEILEVSTDTIFPASHPCGETGRPWQVMLCPGRLLIKVLYFDSTSISTLAPWVMVLNTGE